MHERLFNGQYECEKVTQSLSKTPYSLSLLPSILKDSLKP